MIDRRRRSGGLLEHAWRGGKALAGAVAKQAPALRATAPGQAPPVAVRKPVAPSAEPASSSVAGGPPSEAPALTEPTAAHPTTAEAPEAEPAGAAFPEAELTSADHWHAEAEPAAEPGSVPLPALAALENGPTEDRETTEEPLGSDQARQAVGRYCREMGVAASVDDVFSRVLEREERGPESSANDQERLLASTGIVVADALTSRPVVHTGWRQVLGAEHEDDCFYTARLLALAADDQLDGHDQRALDRHLESCLPCQALELRAARAERVFGATFLLPADVATAPPAPATAFALLAAAAVAVPAAAEVAGPAAAADVVPGAAGRSPALPASVTPTIPGRRRGRGVPWLLAGGIAALSGGAFAVALL
ncbi:MAG: hypothetical protein M3Z06_12740, partial [Actinomycetota bacterium]|nr:hypothetical protein [Actinomycetota bacterium]